MTNPKFYQYFPSGKPIIGTLHLAGDDPQIVLAQAKQEIEILLTGGVDAILVENYFGGVADVEHVLEFLHTRYPNLIFGVHMLGNLPLAFTLARQWGAAFVLVDSVCGHLEPEEDARFAQALADLRQDGDILVFGGVRFKYQPYRSGRTLQEDLALAQTRCDAVLVSGTGSGIPPKATKLRQFRGLLADFPLLAASGVTSANCREVLEYLDGAIVGSFFKFDGNMANPVEAARVRHLIQTLRAE